MLNNQRYGIYNYANTSDLKMSELDSQVRAKSNQKDELGLCLPNWLGLILGYAEDLLPSITGKNLPVSSCVKKCASSNEFRTMKTGLYNFSAPYKLTENIENALQGEFIAADKDQEIFFSE